MALLAWTLTLSVLFLLIENRWASFQQRRARTFFHASYFTFNNSLLLIAVAWLLTPLFNRIVGISDLPVFSQFLLLLLVLDLSSYLLHRLSHTSSILFFFHQVHHSDPEVDASTALRIHVIQLAYSLIPDIAVIYILGPSREAYLLYALVTQLCVFFHHSQLRVPSWIGKLFVTPISHLEHHKLDGLRALNFGSVFSFWDKFFGTQSHSTQIGPLGISGFPNPFSFRQLFLPTQVHLL